MKNDTTFQVNGKIAYVPVVVNEKITNQSNADRIRAMTDEELAEWLGDMLGVYPFGTKQWDRQAWLDWLKKEVEA